MKFVCDQCKAKYQIADDKVVGKTVKMKCRKCGHMIEVRAAVTETSVATALGRDEDKGAVQPQPPAKPGVPPKPPPPRAAPLATSLAAARPAPPKAPPQTKSDAPGALAGAFQRTVQREDETSGPNYDVRTLSAADEWYAAINGVPVGPIRIAELRRKAALGAVTEESLVWQEGLEEWRPVRAFPELAELVREAAAIGRPSLLPPSVYDGRGSTPPPAPANRGGPARPAQTPRPPTGVAARVPTPAPAPATAATAKSNVIPINSRLATAERLDEQPVAHAVTADPFAVPPAADPFAVPPAAAGPTSAAQPVPASAAVEGPASRRDRGGDKRAPNYMAIMMIVLAGGFGITAAVVIFLRPQAQAPAPAPTVVIVQSAAPAPAPPPTVAEPAPAASAVASTNTGKGAAASAGKAGGSPASSTPSAKPLDPSVAALLKGGPGGLGIPGPGGPGPGGGGSLTSDQIESVVNGRKIAVRRACLERTQGEAGQVSARIKVTVGGNGQVSNTSVVSTNDPTAASCIERNIKTWTFPPTGGSSTFEVPFTFVRQ